MKRPRTAPSGSHVLYILMRDDLASLHAGKAGAQSAHASNAFLHHARTLPGDRRRLWSRPVKSWTQETSQGFGTTILKAAPIDAIKEALAAVRGGRFLAAMVHDPEYPLRDGAFTHRIPLDTCAFVFGVREEARAVEALGSMPLMGEDYGFKAAAAS